MLLTTIKRKASIINKLLFMIWGALSVMAAQQLWPSHSPVITPTAANGTSQQVTAQDSTPETLSVTDSSVEHTPTESDAPSTAPYTSIPPQASVAQTPASPVTSPTTSSTGQSAPTQDRNSKRTKANNAANSLHKNTSTSGKFESSSASNASLVCLQAVFCL
jgi:hypothetical protein